MPQLVRVDHAADGLHLAIRDVQRQHVHHVPGAVAGDRAGLPVRLHDPDAGLQLPDPAEQPGEEAGHPVPAVQRRRDRPRLTAAVTVEHRVRGQRPQQPVQVAAVGRGEEPPGDLLAPRPGRLETRLPARRVTSR